MDNGMKLLEIKALIQEHATAENWQEIGLLTGTLDTITSDPRLLRSLSWQDPDYGGNVLSMLQQIVLRKPDALRIIEHYLNERYPETDNGYFISSKPSVRKITFSPSVFAVPSAEIESDFVSIMMPFTRDFSSVNDTIKRACKQCGLRCSRADDIWDESTIIQDIFNLIFRSHIVVVDFSGKNPNVMYEAGIAHTLGKTVVPIVQHIEDVPFDLRHHRALTYLPNSEGLTALEEGLKSKLMQIIAP